MGWVKLYDDMADHPKILRVGPLAGWLYVCALQYANRYLTDGFIPTAVVPSLARLDDTDVWGLVGALVGAGLWDDLPDGFQIHNYLKRQSSAAQIKAGRTTDRTRKQEERASGRSPNGVRPDSTLQEVRSKKEEVDVPETPPVSTAVLTSPQGETATPALSTEARQVVDYWRRAHGKSRPPKLNDRQRAKLEEAVQDLGVTRLLESADWSAEQGVPEFIKAVRAAYTKRQQDETPPPAPARNGHAPAGPRSKASRDPVDYFRGEFGRHIRR